MDAAWAAGKPWVNSARMAVEGRYSVRNMVDYGMTRATAEALLDRLSKAGTIAVDIYDARAKKAGIRVLKTPTTADTEGFG